MPLMPNMDTAYKPTKSRLKDTTVREAVMRSVQDAYELDGLEAANEKFKAMRELYADYTPEWSVIAGEVLVFFKDKKKEEQTAAVERERQMTAIWADSMLKGQSANQVNLMFGKSPQAPYYSSTPTATGGMSND